MYILCTYMLPSFSFSKVAFIFSNWRLADRRHGQSAKEAMPGMRFVRSEPSEALGTAPLAAAACCVAATSPLRGSVERPSTGLSGERGRRRRDPENADVPSVAVERRGVAARATVLAAPPRRRTTASVTHRRLRRTTASITRRRPRRPSRRRRPG